MSRLLQGKGPDLGPVATRFDQPQRTMLHVLAWRAQERPGRVWLQFDGEDGSPVELTYGEAQARVNQVGHAILRDLNGAANIGLMMRNQVEFFPTFYGAMAARGVAVPLNADSRGVLLQRVIEQAELRLIVVRGDLLETLAGLDSLGQVSQIVVAGSATDLPDSLHGARVVAFEDWIAEAPDTAPAELPDSSEIALVQFTSGTTGNSKGVEYPHHFLYLYSAIVTDGQGHTEDDVLTTPLPLFHVAALHIVSNSAMHVGAKGVLRARFSASSYWQEVADSGATFGILLGPLAAILMRRAADAPAHRMRTLFCLPFPPDGEEFERRFGVKIRWQGYGMTEVYPHPMQSEMIPDVPYDTVGHAPAWMTYGAVDEFDRMVPTGEAGELVYRPLMPDAMARGYYKNPEATATAWRNFMFHTGDVGRIDEQGRVHFQGRLQDRIRRRGENISAAELEFVAMSHEQVVEAAAFGVPGEFGEHEVKLDVVSTEPEFDLHGFHAWLEERIPRFMVPRYLELLLELPKRSSAKVQKHRVVSAGVGRPQVLVFEAKSRSGRVQDSASTPTLSPAPAASGSA
jgi:crotonobetaine/carnitine-CoA ligase